MPPSTQSRAKPPQAEFRFEATGTHWVVLTEILIDAQTQRRLLDYVEEFENVFSRFRGKSLVSDMARKAGVFDFPDFAAPLFQLYEQLELATNGRLTPLIGKNLSEAGYDANYSFQPQTLTTNRRLKEVLKFDGAKVETAEPLQLDFAAAGKGLLIDLIGQFLEQNGRKVYTINGGGDIKTTALAKIGLEHPADPSMAIGTADIDHGSLCGSSPNRRQWGNYSHIIDGFSLVSPHNVAASWAWADNAMLADGLTTALHMVRPNKLSGFKFEYAMLHADGRAAQSAGFVAGINGATRAQS